MPTRPRTALSTRGIDLALTLTERGDKPAPDLRAYGFDADGRLVAEVALPEGRGTLKAGAKGEAIAQVLVGALPKSFDVDPTPAVLKRYGALPIDQAALTAGKAKFEVAAPVWHNWLFVACHVQGRVLKSASGGGVVQELPICNAVVHICEVDRIFWLIDTLPDLELARLARELVDIVEHPRPPIPDPDPDPGPLAVTERAARVFGRLDAVALNPQPLPPVDGARLAPEIRTSLLAPSAQAARIALKANVQLLIPNLCWFEWLRPWFFRRDELTTAVTDEDGRFSATVWYSIIGDHPDLYFWVEAPVAGVLTTVYQPSIPCHTWWNYACGTDVTLRVTDPRVQGCGDYPTVLGPVVILRGIGNDISAGEVLRSDAGAREGLSPQAIQPGLDSPFGAELDLRADFGTGLVGAGVTHYAWSYRPLGSTDDNDWLRLTRPVSRYYETTDSPPQFKSLQIGPDPSVSGFYTALNPALPPDFDEWHPIEDHIDQATGYFDTTDLIGGDLSSGKYELKLELFKPGGGGLVRVDLTTAGIGAFQVTQPGPFGGATIVPDALPAGVPGSNDRLLYDGAGHVVGLRLVVHVDNRPCSGTILDVTLDGLPAGRCGFLEYGSGAATAHLSFEASQPGDFAYFDFATTRVATGLPSGTASGAVADVNANGFARAGTTFAKDLSVTTLLTEAVPVGEAPCTRSAFAEGLHVYSSATNGYGRLTYLDAPRAGQVGTRAFAIESA